MSQHLLQIVLLQADQTGIFSRENMHIVTIVSQLIIAISILNVWVLKYSTIVSDFRSFNFPDWFRNAVGVAKGVLCLILIAGIWVYQLAVLAALAIAGIMGVAVLAHYHAKHSFSKTIPAFFLGLLSLLVAWLSWNYQFKG